MWRDREEDRTVDTTPGYDLNTCLLWLSSDQSSLCQAPLPAGNFSTHVTPSLNTSPFCFSFSIPLLLFFKNNFLSICWSRSNLPILGSISGLLSNVLLIYSALPCFPSLLSLTASRQVLLFFLSPALSACLRISWKEMRGVGVRDRWK